MYSLNCHFLKVWICLLYYHSTHKKQQFKWITKNPKLILDSFHGWVQINLYPELYTFLVKRLNPAIKTVFATKSQHFRAGYRLQHFSKPLPLPATLLPTSRVPINSTASDSAHGHCWHKQPSVGVSQWHYKHHGKAYCRAWTWGVLSDLNPTAGSSLQACSAGS